jgi:hypothetical protein
MAKILTKGPFKFHLSIKNFQQKNHPNCKPTIESHRMNEGRMKNMRERAGEYLDPLET